MAAPVFLKIDDSTYMSTKAAADAWGLKPKTVAKYCRDGKIIHKFKNGNLGWYIRVDEIKPLSQEEIRKTLILTLQLKNNPDYEIDYSTFGFNETAIESVYHHICSHGYIEPFSIEDKQRIPYDVVLTQKGMEFTTTHKQPSSRDISNTVSNWVSIIANVAQLYLFLLNTP